MLGHGIIPETVVHVPVVCLYPAKDAIGIGFAMK